MKFKVGDKVISSRGYSFDGEECIIASCNSGDKSYDFVCPNYLPGSKWKAYEHELKLIAPTSKIVITSDGTSTLARLYEGSKVVKTAEAKCAPSDTYDFAAGANLAYDRLMRPEPLAKPEPPKHEYKVGDKVKIVANTASHGYEIGEVATLTKRCAMSNGKPYWMTKECSRAPAVFESDIEPYTEPAKPVEPEKPEQPERKFTVTEITRALRKIESDYRA
jgi:hypothetical protein